MKRKTRIGHFFIYLVLIGLGITFILPFFWMVRSSFMEIRQVFIMPPEWIPDPWVTSSFAEVLEKTPIFLYFRNTMIIVVGNIIGVLLTGSMAAYAFARLRWRGRNIAFAVLLSSMMLPSAVTLIPTYIGWSGLGLTNTFAPLILPSFFGGGAFNVFLLRQFFMGIPKELDEAAFIDGASRARIFFFILLPLAQSALVVVALFTFMNNWNDFFNPLIYLTNSNNFTLAVGLQNLKGKYTSKWNVLMAASTLVVAPCVIVFLLGQKHIIGGIALTGLKA